MKEKKTSLSAMSVLVSAIGLAACGGGGGGGGGSNTDAAVLSTSGSVTWDSPDEYSFQATQGHAYTDTYPKRN